MMTTNSKARIEMINAKWKQHKKQCQQSNNNSYNKNSNNTNSNGKVAESRNNSLFHRSKVNCSNNLYNAIWKPNQNATNELIYYH